MKNLKITLAAARVNAGMTQREAAEAIGVSRSTIQGWEAYTKWPNVLQLDAICEAYGLSVDDIIFSKSSS